MYKIINNSQIRYLWWALSIVFLFFQSRAEDKPFDTNSSFNESNINNNNKIQEQNNIKKWNSTEIDLLKKLAERRNFIDQQEKTIQDKQKILTIIEKNIEDKIKYLEVLQKKIEKFEKQNKIEETEKIKGFVKIYESMPPKNAANIFNDMEIDLLVKIISSMKEIKASSILASMNTGKSIEVSKILANKVFK